MKKIFALLLVMAMVFALCACGGSAKEEAPADAPAAPVGEVAESDQASGEPTGEPVAELVEPDASYSKDLDGYKAYVIDALRGDEHAPADIVEMTVESINAATDGNDESFSMMVNQGLILTYDEFLNF